MPAQRFEIPVHEPRPQRPRIQTPQEQLPLPENQDSSAADSSDEEDIVWALPPAADPAQPLPDRHDLGPMSEVCPSCRALHWWEERSTYRHRGHNSTPYSLCCGKGSVDLRPLPPPPAELQDLFTSDSPGTYLPHLLTDPAEARQFRKHIRFYNNAFAFTSMGTSRGEDPIVHTRGVPVFKIGGELYHRIGSLLPPEGTPPRYLQTYIHDDSEAGRAHEELSIPTLRRIQEVLARVNPYAQVLLNSRERLRLADREVHMLVTTIEPNVASRDFNRYNRPHAREVAILVENGSSVHERFERDIVIHLRHGGLQRVAEDHSAFLPLRFPLILPFGSQGWTRDLPTGPLHGWLPDPRERVGRGRSK